VLSVKYELRKRAEREAETRQRIVEAAVDLHTELGPGQTSILAVAERAGVSRPTVYRHFPDQHALLRACSAHVREVSPPPIPEAWSAIDDPERRLRLALNELFAYYEANESLLSNVMRDAETDAAVAAAAEPRRRHAARARTVLARGWNVRGARRRQLTAAIGHAIDFRTWQSLVRRQNLGRRAAIELLARFVVCQCRR
jgi:AcrR family transcriptional regulator